MKIISILSLFLLLNPTYAFSQFGSIATYNIRYDGHTALANDWAERKVPISKMVLDNNVGIIGFQEVLDNQLLDLQALLANYKYVGVGRDDGKTQGEYSPIFYDSTKFEALHGGTFWLSPTPEIPSKGWDAALNRICTYVLLKNINNPRELIWVFNTHFDHVGVEARLRSAELITEQIAAYQKEQAAPVLLVGDFNMEPTDRGILLLKSKYHDLCASVLENESYAPLTFNGFTKDMKDDKRIDYIFGTDSIRSMQSKVIEATFGLSYPSDHFPVLVFYKDTR